MASLRNRLVWDEAGGALFDGPRRYLMMRPDVLMGALVALDEPARHAWLEAWAASTQQHGGASLKAYAEALPFDADALMAATVQAAADLGWGSWQLERDAHSLRLTVTGSPFVDGWRSAGGGTALQPVCAPVRGMLGALATLVLPGGGVGVEEAVCAAMQPQPQSQPQSQPMPCTCTFTARRAA